LVFARAKENEQTKIKVNAETSKMQLNKKIALGFGITAFYLAYSIS